MINKTTDRVVPNRDDVLFNIVDNSEPDEPIDPVTPSPITPREFVAPSTGVN